MDQKKTGLFMKELRKEKGLTQSQLAEKFNVSDRTISRWETGSNMPDLSLLVDLADYYDVDIQEIISGERKSENMEKEEKETLQMVADYAEQEKQTLLRRIRIIDFLGFIAMLAAFALDNTVSAAGSVSYVQENVIQCLYGFTFGVLLTNLLYTTGILAKVRETKTRCKKFKIGCVLLACFGILYFVISEMM